MVELKLRMKTIDLPFTVRIHNVTEELFDELADEDTKAELLDGVMIVHSPASIRHDKIAHFLRTLAGYYGEDRELGDVFGPDSLVHLATCRKFAPDVFFVVQHRLAFIVPEKEFEGTPDWIIEVLSPSNREDDLEDKRPAYQQANVKEIWFVDPDNQEVTIDRLRRKAYSTIVVKKGKIESSVVPGFWIDAAWLWSWPLPRASSCLRNILK